MVTEIVGIGKLVPKGIYVDRLDNSLLPMDATSTIVEKTFTSPVLLKNLVIGCSHDGVVFYVYLKDQEGNDKIITHNIVGAHFPYGLAALRLNGLNVEKEEGLFKLIHYNSGGDCNFYLKTPLWCFGWKIVASNGTGGDVYVGYRIVAELY